MPKTGYISASMAKAVLTKGRGSVLYGETFNAKAKEIGASIVGYDITFDISSIAHVQHGLEYEAEAINAYMAYKDAKVHSMQQWQQHQEYPFGCTPDGLVDDDGMIEVKCPNSNNHLDNIMEGKQIGLYVPQMQFSMLVTGRAWCDFISYDPRAPEGLKLFVERVYRDDAKILELVSRGKTMHDMALDYAETLKIKMQQQKAVLAEDYGL